MPHIDLAAIAQQCDGAHRDKQGWRARCPVHRGKSDTSLHLWEEGGLLRVHCFGAGCAPKDILASLNMSQERKPQEPDTIFSYHDVNGHLLFQVCRMPPKRFFQRQPHPTQPGRWLNHLKGISPVLYRLPEVLRAKEAELPIYLVEGEKDVETLRAYGCVATTNPMGAKKWEEQYTEALRGAKIILLPDNDPPGQAHADLVTARLTGSVARLVRVDLPGLPLHGDVSDWLQAHTMDELQSLVDLGRPRIETPHLVLQPLSQIQREAIEWLWEPYIPLGKLTFLEGDPGNGKTFLALAIATALSKGYALPDQNGHVSPDAGLCRNTIYITAEDGLGDTIRPRAEDMGADLSRIFAVTGWAAGADLHPFNFQQINLLEEAIRDQDVGLVIIDPIDAFLGADIDMYRPNEVKPVMTQIGTIARQTRCAIMFIRHWTKGQNSNARYRGLGSIAFTASVRSQLAVGESLEDDTKRIMAHAKTNLGAAGKSQIFSVTGGIFGWCGIAEIDANTLAQQQPRKREHQTKAAFDWLRDLLKSGPMATQTIMDLSEGLGISWRTVNNAKQKLGILSEKQAEKWYWRLPRHHDDDVPF